MYHKPQVFSKLPEIKAILPYRDRITDGQDRCHVCQGGVKEILKLTQSRVRPRPTGLWQVSKSK